MTDAVTIQIQAKNLNAGNLFSAWAAQMFALQELSAFFWMTIAGVVWTVYFWRRQFILRKQYSANAVRSPSEIWSHAKEAKMNSLVFLLPILFVCFTYIGFHMKSERGLIIGCVAFCTYAVLTLVAERYPIAQFA
jgi:heme/copper-type cytochrome/quinol oxidase subunit 2